MIQTLLSPKEIYDAISSVVPTTDLAKNIRKGNWNAEQIIEISEAIETTIDKKRTGRPISKDTDYNSIRAIMTLLFYSKDRFGHSVNSQEYMAINRLYGAINSALE